MQGYLDGEEFVSPGAPRYVKWILFHFFCWQNFLNHVVELLMIFSVGIFKTTWIHFGNKRSKLPQTGSFEGNQAWTWSNLPSIALPWWREDNQITSSKLTIPSKPPKSWGMKKNLKSLLLKFQTTRPDMTKLSSLFPHMKNKFASKTYVTFAANLKLIPTNATPRRHASRSNHPTVSQAVDASCDSDTRPARRCRSHCSAKVAIQTRTCFETASSKCLRSQVGKPFWNFWRDWMWTWDFSEGALLKWENFIDWDMIVPFELWSVQTANITVKNTPTAITSITNNNNNHNHPQNPRQACVCPPTTSPNKWGSNSNKKQQMGHSLYQKTFPIISSQLSLMPLSGKVAMRCHISATPPLQMASPRRSTFESMFLR